VHKFTPETQIVADEIFDYALERLKMDPPELDAPRTFEDLTALAGSTITADGLGGSETLRLFGEVLAPTCISVDHPRYLSFIPNAPTEYASLFDLVVGASGLYGGSWLEASGAVFAENQALRWIADLAGLPTSAGGVFVQGGTLGNLSALVAARDHLRRQHEGFARWAVVCSQESHSSITSAAKVMDVDVIKCEVDSTGRLTGASVDAAIDEYQTKTNGRVFAVVATSGTTNLGIVDDLRSIGESAKRNGIWFHVDGAYGGAGLAAPSVRHLFDGIEQADSFVVDPHKWLFAPFDACALIYREPSIAKRAHTQHASYLDTLQAEESEWNPSDYAIHLSRRARGLPFWFSLASHGTRKYTESIEETLRIARVGARLVDAHPNCELLFEPTLSIVAFKRIGWEAEDYAKWSDRLLKEQIAFVVPSSHHGEPILRFAIVNPRTTEADLAEILATL
jgi:L-2,4-diaminobutyrate decarboxylase